MAKNEAVYEAAMKRGRDFMVAERWPEAFKAYRTAVSQSPRNPVAYAGLGEACLGLKQLDKALDCFKLAAKYSKGGLVYLRKVADIQERMGQLTEAGRTYLALGELQLRRRHFEDAIANWERAIRLEMSLLGAHKRLAMVYQRQGRTKEAVREYLAIARILQMHGEPKRALQMCRAALRLDPDNEDVHKAAKLIQYGDSAFPDAEEEEAPEPDTAVADEDDAITATVRQMAAAFEAEQAQQERVDEEDVVALAQRQAVNHLNGEILREDDGETPADGLSKLERDALIGQAMDFEDRNRPQEAVACYQRAIAGGLDMPAAYFLLGLQCLKLNQVEAAREVLQLAAMEPTFETAVVEVMSRI